MTSELRKACARSSQVITTDGTTLDAGLGTLFILRELGWRRLWVFSVPPLVWPVELAYAIFAANRPLCFRLFDRWLPRAGENSDE